MKRFLLIAAWLIALPATAAEPQTSGAGGLFQALFGLVVVLGLMGAAAWLLKRLGGIRPQGASAARVVGGVSVGARERVMVVEVADQWIVVGVAPGRVSALGTMPRQAAPQAEEMPASAPNFAQWLKKTIDKRNGNT